MEEYLKKYDLEWLSDNWQPVKVTMTTNKDK